MSDTSGTTTAPTTAPATPTAPTTEPASTTTTEPTPKGDGGEVVYRTQQDFDRAFGERLGRERAKLEREYAAKLDDTKASERAAVTAEFHGKLVESKAEALATSLGFHDPKDALSVIDREKLPIKDGSPDDEAIKKALEDLVKSKPYLVKEVDTKPAPRTGSGKPKLPSGNPDPAGKPEGKLTAAEAVRQLAAQKRH